MMAIDASQAIRQAGPDRVSVRRSLRATARSADDSVIEALEQRHRLGQPVDPIELWRRHDPTGNLFVLSDLIKADIRWRFSRGGSPTAADYLAACDELRADKDRVVSLAYEEYCLLEERAREGRHSPPSPDSFCDRYPNWRDSLRSQLAYHRVISQMIRPASAPARWPSIGDVVEGCLLEEPLGKGGAASVFRAAEQALGNRSVVLKLTTDEGEEEDVLGKLGHRHIVGIHWARPRDPETGLRGICMPYQPGATLDQVLARLPRPGARRTAIDLWKAFQASLPSTTPLPDKPSWPDFPASGTHADAIAWLTGKLADALAHAHDRDVVHRDLKPANILLTVDDGPQLLDFNLARNPNAPERAESAMRGGTLPYMAPEQLEAFLDERFWQFVGPRSDVYALSLVARELLTGQPQENPGAQLPRARAVAAMLDHRKRPPGPIRPEAPDVPHALEAILNRAAQPRPIDRYADAASLADDLRRFLHRQPLRVAENPSLRERSANRIHRARPGLLVLAAVAGLCGLAWLGPWTWSQVHPSPSPSLLGQTLRPYLATLQPRNGKADPEAIQRAIGALDATCRGDSTPVYWANARAILDCQNGGSSPINPEAVIDESAPPPADPDLAAWFHDHGVQHLTGPSVSRSDADEALAAFRLSVLYGPGEPRHWVGLTSACFLAGRRAEGASYATQALKLADERASTAELAGIAALALKFRALFAFQQARQGNLDDPSRSDSFQAAFRDVDRAERLTATSASPSAKVSPAFRRELALIRGRVQDFRSLEAESQGDVLEAFRRTIDAVTAYNRADGFRRDELGPTSISAESDPILNPLALDRRQANARLAVLLEKCRDQATQARLDDGSPMIAEAERLLANPQP